MGDVLYDPASRKYIPDEIFEEKYGTRLTQNARAYREDGERYSNALLQILREVADGTMTRSFVAKCFDEGRDPLVEIYRKKQKEIHTSIRMESGLDNKTDALIDAAMEKDDWDEPKKNKGKKKTDKPDLGFMKLFRNTIRDGRFIELFSKKGRFIVYSTLWSMVVREGWKDEEHLNKFYRKGYLAATTTKKHLAEITNLDRGTVKTIIDEFISVGIIETDHYSVGDISVLTFKLGTWKLIKDKSGKPQIIEQLLLNKIIGGINNE